MPNARNWERETQPYELCGLDGGNHYLSGQSHLVDRLSDEIACFAKSL
jgi:hypothetical protein